MIYSDACYQTVLIRHVLNRRSLNRILLHAPSHFLEFPEALQYDFGKLSKMMMLAQLARRQEWIRQQRQFFFAELILLFPALAFVGNV